MVRFFVGDCRDVLATLPADSVHCVVTSPPYWGLRDYGVAGQIGLEGSYQDFVAEMVAVFREVRRVLRPDGTLWLNLGDSYCGAGYSNHTLNRHGAALRSDGGKQSHGSTVQPDLKSKDLCGIPWKVAQALQAPYYTGRIKSERDRIWLAAIMDGEGTICGFTHERKDDGRVRTGANMFVTNSCDRMLAECARIWPAARYEHMIPSEGHLGTKPVHRWVPNGAEEKALLLAEILPYLVSKKQQALVAWNLLQFVQDGKSLGRGGLRATLECLLP